MSTIRLTPHSEELLQEQLTRGTYRSPEEVIERALETLAQKESIPFHLGPATKSPADAVNGAAREQSEFRWLALNRQQYAGRWVALEGEVLLAVGDSAREVHAAVAAHEGTPLVTREEPEEHVCFAGW